MHRGTVGGEGNTSPSLRDALEYELNMIESSIEAFENEVEALKALIDWHVSVAIDPNTNGGWQLVPEFPTYEMIDFAYSNHNTVSHDDVREIYDALLESAPKYREEE